MASFLDNPVVQKSLKDLKRGREGSITDFIKKLLFQVGGGLLENIKANLPSYKQSAVDDIKLERDIALKQVEGDYGAHKPQRDFYQQYQLRGDDFLTEQINKEWKNSNEYRLLAAQQIPDVSMFAKKEYGDYVDAARVEMLNRIEDYSKNEYITEQNPFKLAEPIYDRYRNKTKEINADPRYKDVMGFLIGQVKEKHGPVVAAELSIGAKMEEKDVKDKIEGAKQVSNLVLNPEIVTNIDNKFDSISKNYNITTYRNDKIAVEEAEKAFKILIDEDLYDDRSEVTLSVNKTSQEKDMKIFKSYNQKKAKIKTWNGSEYVTNLDLSGKENSLMLALSDTHGELSAYLSDDYDMLNIPGGRESRLIGHIDALAKSNHLYYDGDTIVYEVPRTDLISKKLENVNVFSPTTTDIVNTLLSDNFASKDIDSLTMGYFNYRKDMLNNFNRLKEEAFTNQGVIKIGEDTLTYENIIDLEKQFQNMFDGGELENKNFLMFLLDPPDSYKNKRFNSGDNIITLGKIDRSSLEAMIAKHETTYNDGAPIAELRDLLPPEPEPTIPSEEDKTLDEQVEELTTRRNIFSPVDVDTPRSKIEKELDEEGPTIGDIFRTLTAPTDVDTPRRRNLLDR